MSGCLPVWTNSNSGIFPIWLGEDVTPRFDFADACVEWSLVDQNFGFSGAKILVPFTVTKVNAIFTKTCS